MVPGRPRASREVGVSVYVVSLTEVFTSHVPPALGILEAGVLAPSTAETVNGTGVLRSAAV